MTLEHHKQPLLSKPKFVRRVAAYTGVAVALVVVWWAVGTIGYHVLEGLPWIDSQLNAAMILSGMGPVNELHSDASKLFAAVYALISGVVFLAAVAVIFAPIVHRFLHRFHLELDAKSSRSSD
jgi:hypothetical protein